MFSLSFKKLLNGSSKVQVILRIIYLVLKVDYSSIHLNAKTEFYKSCENRSPTFL